MKYRREVDGLRAVAVLPVILFHAGVPLFAGGFVGVDVFFVISGFLITSLLLGDLQAGRFSLLEFYERRARRILPALFFIMALCIPFAWMWLVPRDLESFFQSMIGVATFSSNIFFWKENNYFATAAELKPLLHTWSLAVEEQYYIIFPLILWGMWRFGLRTLVVVLSITALLSLGLAHWGSTNKPSATFYLLPTRAWELLFGALAAFYMMRPTAPKGARPLNQTLSLIGLGLIAVSIFVFDPQTPFPSLYAVVPTLGTVLILVFAHPGTLAHRILATKAAVGIGLISYSAYLWHQPIFAFMRLRSLHEPSIWALSLAGLAVLPLAYLTWRFVEAPFRTRQDRGGFGRRAIFTFSAIGMAAFIAMGFAGHITRGFDGRTNMLAAGALTKTVQEVHCHQGGRRSAAQLAAGDFCLGGDRDAIGVAVLGDSHAGASFDALSTVLGARGIGFWAVSGSFCPPLYDLVLREWGGSCDQPTNIALDAVIANPDITTVVLLAQWANYTQGYRDDMVPGLVGYGDEIATSPEDNPRLFAKALRRSIDALHAAGKEIILVEPVPEFEHPVLNAVVKGRLFTGTTPVPQMSLQRYHARNEAVLKAMDDLENVQRVSPRSLFCDETTCSAVRSDGAILFSDTNHVTDPGARMLAEAISTQIKNHSISD